MSKNEVSNSVYEIGNKARGIKDLLILMDLGAADKKSDIGDALTPVVDLMCDLCDMIDQLQADISNQTAERDPVELPFT